MAFQRARFSICLVLLSVLFVGCGKERDEIPQPLPPERVILPNYPAEGFYENASANAVFRTLESARRSIDIEIYLMWDKDVHGAIDRALARGVRVRIILDEEASRDCKLLSPPKQEEKEDCTSFRALLSRVVEKGGSVKRFSKENLCGTIGKFCHQHGKLILVDETFALISSGNFNPPNLCNKNQKLSRCNRDYSFVTYDPNAIQTLVQVFENDLVSVPYDLKSIVDAHKEQKLTISPISADPILEAIRSANKSIQVENQYLNDPNMNQALIEAATRGVKVEVTTASACAFGKPTDKEKEKWIKTYSAFEQAGISSRMFTRSMKVADLPGYLHGKALLVDQRLGWVGSINGSFTAFSLNREFGIFFEDTKEVSKLDQFLVKDHLHPNSVSWQESLLCHKERIDQLFSFLWSE